MLQVKRPLDEIHAVGTHHKSPLTPRRCLEHMPRVVCRKFRLCVVHAIVFQVHVLDIFKAHAQFTLDAAHEIVVGAQVCTETLARVLEHTWDLHTHTHTHTQALSSR